MINVSLQNSFILFAYLFTHIFFSHFSPKAPLYDLIGHGDKILDIDWSNPKYIVSGGADNTVRVYKSRKALSSEMAMDTK